MVSGLSTQHNNNDFFKYFLVGGGTHRMQAAGYNSFMKENEGKLTMGDSEKFNLLKTLSNQGFDSQSFLIYAYNTPR